MKTLPLVRQYHPNIVNTEADVYSIKNKVSAKPVEQHPDPFQVTDRLGINKMDDTKIRIVIYNSKGLCYFI